MARRDSSGDDRAIYIISVAAELAGVHPQTLRVYERKGLVQPSRTSGNTRRYSDKDIDRLRRIQELTNEGVNLAGVTRIMELENQLERARSRYEAAVKEVEAARDQLEALAEERASMAMVPLKDVRRVRRALKVDVIDEAGKRRTFQVPPASS
ncbi:MAG TPA: MerR family transcriptional regulator [Actinomycetota bacterium]|nr:MerR family transcriptional regulator [Actinomycetota bacterium]